MRSARVDHLVRSSIATPGDPPIERPQVPAGRSYVVQVTEAEQQQLYSTAATLARDHQAEFSDDGEGIAASALTESGQILSGVSVDAMVASACLCVETEPICTAHRTGDRIVASICIRWTESDGATVLPACGVCQERLVMFGRDVLVGLPADDHRPFRFVPLADLRPSPWWDAWP